MVDLQVVAVDQVSPTAVVAAINLAFTRDLSLDWFRWKHQEGPWGPSRGWVAVRDGEVVGTRLFTPWAFTAAEQTFLGARAMDGATVPTARRQGIFSRLITTETALLEQQPTWTCLVSTAVPASREAYRGLGWTILPATSVRYQPALSLNGRDVVITSPGELELIPALRSDVLATAWTAQALRWRTDARSGREYRLARLRRDGEASGLVFRVLRQRRLRVLAVIHAWGSGCELRRLISATSAAEGTVAVLDVDGPGTSPASCRPGLRRYGSTVSLWTHPDPAVGGPVDPHLPTSWGLTQADLEGVL